LIKSNCTVLIAVIILSAQFHEICGQEEALEGSFPYSYRVQKCSSPPHINSVWDKAFWNEVLPASLDNFMGEKPSHFPETNVKLRYDSQYIYVIFKVKDQYVKAVEKKRNGKVWQDSCVELFFSPGSDVARGYFNFEANCKGVYLFQYHTENGSNSGFLEAKDCRKIKIAHSLKRDTREESANPEKWTLEYRIPIAVLENYMEVEIPGPGTTWRANFYKCADKSSHPHWLTWAPVEHPEPKFHLPEFFGRLEFE
jgi:hypothetical protein